MKISINLASEPFRRDRALLASSIAVSVLLVMTLGVLVSLALSDRAQLADVRRDISDLNTRIRKISTEQAQMDVILQKPANAEVLEKTVFINSLLYRKGISWTRLFVDLEKVLPYNVRIMQIHPSLNSSNQVTLDMTVGSESQKAVIDFFEALQSSSVFGSVLEHSSVPPSQSEPLHRYRLSVTYAQKL